MPIGFSGSLLITGSLYVNGVLIDGVSSSYAVTASYASNGVDSASNALVKTGSTVELGGFMYRNTVISSSDYSLNLKKTFLTYDSDYSQFFTSRSLVDKGYTDSKFSGSSSITGSLSISGSFSSTNLVLTGSAQMTGSVTITGSLTLYDLLSINTFDPLPTSGVPTGSIAASGSDSNSKPYYWNGNSWNQLF